MKAIMTRSHLIRACQSVASACLASLLAGCFGPSETEVQLLNQTEFPVEVRLFYGDDQNLPEELLEAIGTEVTVTVNPGGSFTFSRDCEELQALFIEDAEIRVAPGISPDAATDVFREPDDFGCGDTLSFAFTANATNTDLDITFANIE